MSYKITNGTYNLQAGRPLLKSNAAQMVLKYMLLNRNLISKAWRQRIYYYSSATTFSTLSPDLEEFMEDHENAVRIIAKLEDVDALYELVGDAIISFMQLRPTFFRDALLSKKHFWLIPSWKRAMTWVFYSRFLTGKRGMSIIIYKIA